jgi:hypothetical protein
MTFKIALLKTGQFLLSLILAFVTVFTLTIVAKLVWNTMLLAWRLV